MWPGAEERWWLALPEGKEPQIISDRSPITNPKLFFFGLALLLLLGEGKQQFNTSQGNLRPSPISRSLLGRSCGIASPTNTVALFGCVPP